MIEDAWNDYPEHKIKPKASIEVSGNRTGNEDFSGLSLVSTRQNGTCLYKDLHSGGYVICSPSLKDEIYKERWTHDNVAF